MPNNSQWVRACMSRSKQRVPVGYHAPPQQTATLLHSTLYSAATTGLSASVWLHLGFPSHTPPLIKFSIQAGILSPSLDLLVLRHLPGPSLIQMRLLFCFSCCVHALLTSSQTQATLSHLSFSFQRAILFDNALSKITSSQCLPPSSQVSPCLA